MKVNEIWLLVLGVLLCVGFVTACSGDDDDDNSDQDTSSSTEDDTGTETTSDTSTATQTILDSDHTGWQDPDCASCHPDNAHTSGLNPDDCVVCHGTNGAPPGHSDSLACNGCHYPYPSSHPQTGLTDPDSCQACHPY